MNSKQIKIVVLIMILYSFIACNKQNDTYIVKGKVLEYGTNTPVDSAKVQLELGIKNPQSSYTDSVFTDASGNFSLEFPDDPASSRLYISKNNFHTYTSNKVIAGRINLGQILLDPKGWINMHIINNTGLNHELLYNVSWGQPQPNFYFGDFFDFYQNIEVYANRENIIYWTNTLNGVSSNFIDSLYVPAFDTVEYTIKL